jgi:hypothetical protein
MLTTRHPVDFPYSRQELDTLFRYANEHDGEKGGRYDARSAAVNIWSHHWLHPATHAESETIGSFYFHWEPPVLWEIETDEGFSAEGLELKDVVNLAFHEFFERRQYLPESTP